MDLRSVLFPSGERSEPEGKGTERSGGEFGPRQCASPCAYRIAGCIRLEFLLFLRTQETEAGAFAQKIVGGVRELVQPTVGLRPVRSPARAAHAQCSKLEPLPERQSYLPARIRKDELEHDNAYANPKRSCLCRN